MLRLRNQFAVLTADHEVEYVDSVYEWGRAFESSERFVAQTGMRSPFGGVVVSTVFLGLDHSMGGPRPLWFETMVFVGSFSDLECERYETWDEAAAGHAAMVRVWRWKRWYYPLTTVWERLTERFYGIRWRIKQWREKNSK